MSANNQLNRELGRRDDLEALLYMAVYMFKQELPWESIAVDEPLREKNLKRAEMKQTIEANQLCSDMPAAYAQIYTIIRRIEFEERPPYRKLIGLLRQVMDGLGITLEEHCYDWDRSQQAKADILRL